MTIFASTILNIKEIWVLSFGLFRKAFWQTWSLGMVIGVTVVISLWFMVYNDVSWMLVFLGVFTTLFGLYVTAFILYRIFNIGNENDISARDAAIYVGSKYFKVAVSMISVFILFMLGLLLIVPGIFLFVAFSMVLPLILLDGNDILESFKGSFHLVWGNWWRSFVVIFPLIFVDYLLVYYTGSFLEQGRWSAVGVGILLSAVYYPMYYSCILVLFNDLKLRKEKDSVTGIIT